MVRTLRDGQRKGSLIWVMDRSRSPMGARLMRLWIVEPLRDVESVRLRQDAVAELYEDEDRRDKVRDLLKQVQDIERLLARVSTGRATARAGSAIVAWGPAKAKAATQMPQ